MKTKQMQPKRPPVNMAANREYGTPLDPGIAREVEILRAGGIETFESCEGGKGHAFPEPTIRFYGGRSEGFKAMAIAMAHALPVQEIRRTWGYSDGEPTGPWWEIVFWRPRDQSGAS